MLKRIPFFVLLMASFASAQDIQILSQIASSGKPKAKSFHFIAKEYDLVGKQAAGRLKGCIQTDGKKTLVDLFYSFWRTANKLGANSFSADSLSVTPNSVCFILKVYSLSEADLDGNYALYPANMVYVIGDIDRRRRVKTIKFNKEKMELNPMECISFQNGIGEKCTLSVGGIMGARVSVIGQAGGWPEFYSMGGFGVAPGGAASAGGNAGFGLTFNTGRIEPLECNLGLFLLWVLKEKRISKER